MTKQEFKSISSLKVVCVLLVFIAALWSYIYTIIGLDRQGYIYEIGELVFLVIKFISLYSIIPMIIIELIKSKLGFFTLGNLFCYFTLITFAFYYSYDLLQSFAPQ